MDKMFSPLFARLKQKYTRFPVGCGIVPEPTVSCFARAKEKTILLSTYTGVEQLDSLINAFQLTDVVCISVAPEHRYSEAFDVALQKAQEEAIPVIVTQTEAVLAALGLPLIQGKKLGEALTAMGLTLRSGDRGCCPEAALAALTGYFYLNYEYEIVGRNRNVVPLVLEKHPLYSFIRSIPYGEVATYGEVAKVLGLQWNEQMVMTHLYRLPDGIDVAGHRLVGRDGRLSEMYPGGLSAHRERLTWELVPFVDREHVNLRKAKWTPTKYRALTNYLRHAATEVPFLELRFSEIERIIGGILPKAAQLGIWWRDDQPYTDVWHKAGWKITHVNVTQETVTFARME